MEHKKCNLIEILLIIAISFSPYTSLRFSFFGITEVIIMIIWIIIYKDGILVGRSNKYFIFTRALLGIASFSIVGWFFNIFIFKYNSGTVSSALFNLLSIIFVTITLYALEITYIREIIDYAIVLKYSFWSLSLSLNVLYILSLFTNNIGSLTLKEYYMFCPLADNIHQVAMISVQLPFIGGYFAANEKKFVKKIFMYCLSVGDIIVSWMTNSTKAKMGIIVGFLILLFYFLILNTKYTKQSKKNAFVIYIIIFIGTFLVLMPKILNFFEVFFAENDGQGARKNLYKSAFQIIKKSPIFGLGPSCHVIYDGRYFDAHETFLTVALISGCIGVGFLIVLYFKVFIQIKQSGWLLAACATIFIYALGGDVLRRLPVWVLMELMFLMLKRNESSLLK